MLDIKLLRRDFDNVKKALKYRNEDISALDQFLDVDKRHRELIQRVEHLKSMRNTASREIAQAKRQNKSISEQAENMRKVGIEIADLDNKLRGVDQELDEILLSLPNIPNPSVPIGLTEEENVEMYTRGEKFKFDFEVRPHWDVAEQLNILDFQRASKVTGSRFVFYIGAGAKLERALTNLMLDLHTEKHGYTEMLPPYIVNKQSLYGAGNLPKFSQDLFALTEHDYYLIPTAEAPVTNFFHGEILDVADLPKCFAAYSSCFRSEAGSAGRDTRGLIRLHQFQKIELVKFVDPQHSEQEHENLVADAEKVLELLGLPYRRLLMCTGDMGFQQQKKYDLEVWMPGSDCYREISSCSNFGDFQARRANIRFKRDINSKTEFVHTLNGSGLAIGRTVAAILENYQQSDGTIRVPKELQPYMGCSVIS